MVCDPRGTDHSSMLWHVIAETDLGDGDGKHGEILSR